MINEVIQGDCLDVMRRIEDKSIDMVLCDLPYGTISCKWDVIIPPDLLWKHYRRIVKKGGAIILFGSEPFSSLLITSNLKGFKYRWDWDKKIPSGMSYARFRPMQQTEDILVFTSEGEKTVYNPQKIKRDVPIKSGGTQPSESAPIAYKDKNFKRTYRYKNPITLISFDKVRRGAVHPTQKPVALLEYLIKTYTNDGDLVLDNAAGSCTTAIAAENLNRNWICIEKEKKYCDLGRARIRANGEKI